MSTTKKKIKITKEDIEILAHKIHIALTNLGMDDALCIYYNNERINTYTNGEVRFEHGMHAKEYCAYAPEHNIITIASEGMLYEYFNIKYEMPDIIEKLIKPYGLYFEQIESWNWSLCPDTLDWDEIECDIYQPKF